MPSQKPAVVPPHTLLTPAEGGPPPPDRGEKPSLLFVAPVMPLLSGNGLAMRCGMTLEVLADLYRVSLLVVPLYPPRDRPIPEFFAERCERTAVAAPEAAPAAYQSMRFDAVHAYRLAAFPFARPYFAEGSGRFRSLDLDDIESRTHRAIAALHLANSDARQAELADGDAKRYLLLEGLAFRMLDRVSVCSEHDRQLLLPRCPAPIAVWPNTARPPAAIAPRPDGVFRFLFVGTLGYYPNHDAVIWFCRSILPLIAQAAPGPFTLDIVGGGASEALAAAAAASGARLLGKVAELQPVYEAAHAVIAPLRAGGGTRIKILEAFSHGRPVVSTPAGIEGIEAVEQEHALIAESPEAFAAACLRLMSDQALGDRLAANAATLWSRLYSPEALQRAVSSPAGPPVRR